MTKTSKIIFYLILIILTILSAMLVNYYLDQNIYSGNIILTNPELSGPIYIHTDNNGFVHIKAKTRTDFFYALGVAHARDRLFIMDLERRLAKGRVSEFFGEKTLELDKIIRSIGFGRIGERDVKQLLKMKEHSKINEVMKMYCDGINYWANKHYLPIEYYLINEKWENWTYSDSMAFFRFMDWSMSGDHEFEIVHHLIHDFLGKNSYELFYKTLLYDYPYFNDTYIPESFLKEKNLTTDTGFSLNLESFIDKMKIPEVKYKVSSINQNDVLKGFDSIKEGQASNSWMVSGNYTKSGKPIFSNDPHLHNRIPGIHYIVKAYIEKNDEVLVGSAVPGCPFIIIGNNRHLAYGFTTDYRDRSDYVEELLDNEDIERASCYYVDGKKHSLKTIREIINVKDNFPYIHIVRSTRNGPLINFIPKEWSELNFDFKYKSENTNISNALSYNFYGFRRILRLDFLYERMFAHSKEDFLPFLKDYIGPPFSLSWATVEGELGYTPISQYPLKQKPTQIFSHGYNTSDYDNNKINFIPTEDVPVYLNPPEGYFSTANSHPIPASWKYFSTSYEIPWRHHRINELLDTIIHKNKKKYSVADSISILSDTHDSLCELMLPDLVKTINKYIYPQLYTYRYYELLKNFDCNMNKSSRAATVYEVFIYKLMQHLLLKNEINGVKNGFNNEDQVNGFVNRHWFFLVLQKIVNASTKVGGLKFYKNCEYFVKGHHCEEYIIDVFHRLPVYLEKYGFKENVIINGKNEETVKKWGDVNHHYYTNILDKVSILKYFFARSVFTDGNKNTIKVARNDYGLDLNDPFNSVHSANMKYVNDLSDITRPYICIDTGNSGNIFSKYYDNLIERCEKNHLIKIEDYNFTKDPKNELILNPSN